MITAECARLAALGHRVGVSPDILESIVRAGYHRLLGARPMRGAVQRHLQEAVASNLLIATKGSA